jgi:hypothetical protein
MCQQAARGTFCFIARKLRHQKGISPAAAAAEERHKVGKNAHHQSAKAPK